MSDILGGKYPGLPRPIAGEYSKDWNLYLPIPYAKHCKVTSDMGNFYYHVNYRTYPQGTAVETFRAEQIAALKAELEAVMSCMNAPGDAPRAAGADGQPFELQIAAGQSATLATLSGPRAVTGWKVRWTPTDSRDEPGLRSLVLEMAFDGETTVAAPLGDFFGTSPGLNAYESLPLSVKADGQLASRWVMPFQLHAYHNQPRCDGPGNYGRTSVNRFHILDRIPFTKAFKFDMELWHWKKCQVNMTVGVVGPQDWDGTSEGRHMWWHRGQKPGDKLVLGYKVEQAGKSKVTAQFLKAIDYGIAQVAVNEAKAGDPMDFFNDGVILSGPVELGVFDLKAGENTITFTIEGANPKAVKSYMVGLDYLLLTPAP
jgi:hypothetical protein